MENCVLFFFLLPRDAAGRRTLQNLSLMHNLVCPLVFLLRTTFSVQN